MIQDGRKIQELYLPSKVCTLRPTLLWLIAAFIVPWLLLHYLVYSPIGFQPPLNPDGTEAYVRRPNADYAPGSEKAEPRAERITHFIEDNTPLSGLTGGKKQRPKTRSKTTKRPLQRERKNTSHPKLSLFTRTWCELSRVAAADCVLHLHCFTFGNNCKLCSSARTQGHRARTPVDPARRMKGPSWLCLASCHSREFEVQ